MDHGGMVHALEEIHRLLKPDGCLIDIHPVIAEWFIEVHMGRKKTFVEAIPEFDKEGILQAENALTRVIRCKLFLVERAASFDFLIYAASISELLAYCDEACAYENDSMDEGFTRWVAELAPKVEQAVKTAGKGAEVVYREKVSISRLKPLFDRAIKGDQK
jgi:hypothetical protein